MSDEIPQSNWANWALIRAVKSGGEVAAAAAPIVVERFVATLDEDRRVERYVAVCTGGYWGRGSTLEDAVRNSKARRTERVYASLVLNDPEPMVDGYGTVCAASGAHIVGLGKIGTVGSILNANK